MYEIRLINPLHQFGKIEYSLTFHDTDNIFPDCRIEKRYNDTATSAEIVADVVSTLTHWVTTLPLPEPVIVEDGEPLPVEPWPGLDLSGSVVVVDQIGGTQEQWQI